MTTPAQDRRTPQELVEALRSRAFLLTGAPWEVAATVAMLNEAADALSRLLEEQARLKKLLRDVDNHVGMWRHSAFCTVSQTFGQDMECNCLASELTARVRCALTGATED